MGWKTAVALAALTFLGVGSLVYLLFHKDEENDDRYFQNQTKTQVEVKIPKESVGIVIGRGGNTLRDIESQSGTTIKVLDDDISGDFKTFIVKGPPESVHLAECLLHDAIVSQPLIETFDMYIPAYACGRIIGKGGDNIRMICRSSNAKLLLENCTTSPVSFERKLTIKGTSEQIALAKILVEQKLEEENEFRKKLETQVSNRPPRHKLKYLLPAKSEEEEVESYRYKEKFVATGSSGMLEVYVSSIQSPDRFWLQMVGPSTVDLDRLNEQMTDYYSKEENKTLHKLQDIKCGQIVAAPFTYDKKWYRAEVIEVRENGEESGVVLYYVDYGDNYTCKKENVYELRTDFLRLRFQAVECMLAKVKPRDSTWSPEAIELLADLTHVAMWKPLIAKVHTYRQRPTRAKREGSPIPCVELYDTHGERTVNVAEELVEKGFAVWDESMKAPDKSTNGIG